MSGRFGLGSLPAVAEFDGAESDGSDGSGGGGGSYYLRGPDVAPPPSRPAGAGLGSGAVGAGAGATTQRGGSGGSGRPGQRGRGRGRGRGASDGASQSIMGLHNIGRTGGKARATGVFLNDPSMMAAMKEVRATAAADRREADAVRQRAMGARGRTASSGSQSPTSAVTRRSGARPSPRGAKPMPTSPRPMSEGGEEAARVMRHGRAEEFKLQQLRGIFAAFDENRDGILSKEELGNALLALGIVPSQKAIQRYHMSSSTSTRGSLDLPTFLRVSMHKLDGLERTKDQIADLFAEFDDTGSGTVPAYIIRHVMSEVRSSTELSDAEVQDLLQFTGLSSTGTFGRRNNPMAPVDYNHLIDIMRW